jgi:glucose/arabinose dehydrogenase
MRRLPFLPLGLALVLALAPACGDGGGADDPGTGDPGSGDPGSGDPGGPPPPSGEVTGRWAPIATGLDEPVHAAAPPGEARLFVVERGGRVRLVKDGAVLEAPFLDITGLVRSTGTEEGLLSIAFHPAFPATGRFFVYYTDLLGDLAIAEYAVATGTPDRADPSSGRVILSIPHPGQSNHNGGQLAFGPDGLLYVGVGDGGGAGDPSGHGQDTGVLLGKLLRLDVDGDGAAPYAIPPGNPGLPAPEIWAYGLRNPWRFSFDRATGDLYVGDVGQSGWEEVNFQPAGAAGGLNYGWSLMEGDGHCFDGADCTAAGLEIVRPVAEYPTADGCAVTGGFVYRGAAVPALTGTYLYADFCTGEVLSLRMSGREATAEAQLTAALGGALPLLASFGEDGSGELLAIQMDSAAGGRVLRLAPR